MKIAFKEISLSLTIWKICEKKREEKKVLLEKNHGDMVKYDKCKMIKPALFHMNISSS